MVNFTATTRPSPASVSSRAASSSTATSPDGYRNGSPGYASGGFIANSHGVSIENAMGFQAPQASGIKFNDLFTVFLNGFVP
jgi:hypothetical protein